MSSSVSVGSGAFRNHHWISKYTEGVPLWKAHAISMFCPSLTVMLEGRSVKRPADERVRGGGGEWWWGLNHPYMHTYEIISLAPPTHHVSRSLKVTPFLGTLHKAQPNRILVMHISNYGHTPLSYSGSFLPFVRNFVPNKLDSSRIRARNTLNRLEILVRKATGSSFRSFVLHKTPRPRQEQEVR